MKDEPRSPTKHQLDHAVPTVIHHPEEDLPLLACWLYRAMADRTRFWTLIVGLVVVVLGLTILASGLSVGRAASDEAWTRLELAKTAAERVEIAKEYPNTPAERWALLQAATEYFEKGVTDLPANRDVALPDLKKALEFFDKVAKESPNDSPQARAAAYGAARALEARNELSKAIDRYEDVAKAWPDSDEGKQAKRMAELLRKPESIAFYKELYAYKPSEVTLPPGGQGDLTLPPGHPAIGESVIPDPLSLPPPPPPPSGTSTKSKTETEPLPPLPPDVFSPPASSKADSTPPASKTKDDAAKP